MNKRWFTKLYQLPLVYIPAKWQGFLVSLFFTLWIILNFLRVDSQSHSVSDTLLNVIPQTIVIIVLHMIVAYIITRLQTQEPKK